MQRRSRLATPAIPQRREAKHGDFGTVMLLKQILGQVADRAHQLDHDLGFGSLGPEPEH